MITVSACLIVKNEERALARCLEGVRRVADEIVIVDTGSVDDTLSIAAKYTDKVYHFTWIDDFAAARNYAFGLANMEYIYMVDADEVLDDANIGKFLELKRALLPEIDIVQMYYTNQLEHNTTYNYDKELRPKLFKRLREFRFEGEVHERVILHPVIYDSDIEICHKPHASHAERDLRIFRKIIQEKGRLIKELEKMYAKELFIAGTKEDFELAQGYFEQLAEDCQLTLDEVKVCQCVLAKNAIMQGDMEYFYKIALKNMATNEASSEICYELGRHFHDKGDYKEAIIWYYNAIYETKPELDIRYGTRLPIEGMISVQEALGNADEVRRYKVELDAMQDGRN